MGRYGFGPGSAFLPETQDVRLLSLTTSSQRGLVALVVTTWALRSHVPTEANNESRDLAKAGRLHWVKAVSPC